MDVNAAGWPGVITTVLDGLLAALAFSHLMYVARLGAMDGAARPRSTNTVVVFGIGFAIAPLLITLSLLEFPRRPRPHRDETRRKSRPTGRS